MNEVLVIDRPTTDGVASVEVQVVALNTPDVMVVVAGGGQGPPGVTTAIVGAPASASSPGTTGEVRVAPGFVYLCVATDTWQRAALTNF
jgi:hypothetical protein